MGGCDRLVSRPRIQAGSPRLQHRKGDVCSWLLAVAAILRPESYIVFQSMSLHLNDGYICIRTGTQPHCGFSIGSSCSVSLSSSSSEPLGPIKPRPTGHPSTVATGKLTCTYHERPTKFTRGFTSQKQGKWAPALCQWHSHGRHLAASWALLQNGSQFPTLL